MPLPDERGPVTDALMNAMLLRRGGTAADEPSTCGSTTARKQMDVRWRDAEENEKRSRARFAQNAMKPAEVLPEWQRARAVMGDPAATLGFRRCAPCAPSMRRWIGGPATSVAPLAHLPQTLRERLDERGLKGSLRLA
ncbi:MAG: hypothetical protein V9G19_08645 [Tetrasphaera sp.]